MDDIGNDQINTIQTYLQNKNAPINIKNIAKGVNMKTKLVHLILKNKMFKRTNPLDVGSLKKQVNVFQMV